MSNIKPTEIETKKCTSCEKIFPHHDMRILIRNLLTRDGVKIKRYYISANCKNCYKSKQRQLYQKNRISRLEYSKANRKTTGGKRGKRMNPKFNSPPVKPE
tara:strand:- start:2750 stop:3052 length:303 start_codon:yes stop_codon:yes gene_type:complete